MFMDKNLQFCDAVDVSAVAGTLLEGDVVDLGGAGEGPADQRPMWLNIHVTTAFTSAGSSTNQFQLASDAVAAIAVDGNQTIHTISEPIPKATLVAGFVLSLAVPSGIGIPYERYLGVQVVTAVATTTAGAIDAYLSFEPRGYVTFADGAN